MAVRTETEALDLVRAITSLIGHADEHGQGDFTADFNALETQIAVGDQVPENSAMTTAMDTVIRNYGTFFNSCLQLARTSYPALGRLGSSPDLNNQNANLDYFQQYTLDTANNIERRGFTKDAATTIVGSGAGLITIATTDVNGSLIDVGHVEDMTYRCVKDFSEGAAAGREQFRPRGEAQPIYPWLEGGSDLGLSYDYPYGVVSADFGSGQSRGVSGGIITSVAGSSGTGNLVLNGGFETQIDAATGQAKLSQWLITTGDAGVADETTDPILGLNSLAITTDFVMDQDVSQNRLLPRSFYFVSLKAERLLSATGTLTMKVMDEDEGTTHVTLTQVIGSLTNDVPVPIQPVIFQVPESAEDLKIQIELASLAVGTIKIDEVVVAPATLVDGYLVAIMDGTTLNASQQAQGRFKNGDEFVIQTASTDAGLIQKFYFNMASSRYIESDAAASANWEDPVL